MPDRTYWHVPGARSWHARNPAGLWLNTGFCGRYSVTATEKSDRVPPNAHLCGSCSRVIAARTDVEDHGPVRAEIFTADDPTMGVTLP